MGRVLAVGDDFVAVAVDGIPIGGVEGVEGEAALVLVVAELHGQGHVGAEGEGDLVGRDVVVGGELGLGVGGVGVGGERAPLHAGGLGVADVAVFVEREATAVVDEDAAG